jgi:hypothetical protein
MEGLDKGGQGPTSGCWAIEEEEEEEEEEEFLRPFYVYNFMFLFSNSGCLLHTI